MQKIKSTNDLKELGFPKGDIRLKGVSFDTGKYGKNPCIYIEKHEKYPLNTKEIIKKLENAGYPFVLVTTYHTLPPEANYPF